MPAKTAAPPRWLGYCKSCWHTVDTDDRFTRCRRTSGDGSPCKGEMGWGDHPMWKRHRQAKAVAEKKAEAKALTGRPEVGLRAGSRLNPATSHPVWVGPKGMKVQHGMLDRATGLWQTGGERNAFIYWARKLVTVSAAALGQIQMEAKVIEIVDHGKNQCWSIAMPTFLAKAERYNAGAGDRLGVPIPYWRVTDAAGEVLQYEEQP